MSCKVNQNKQRVDEQLAYHDIKDGQLVLMSDIEKKMPTLLLISRKFGSSTNIVELIGNQLDPNAIVKVKVNYPIDEASDENGNVKQGGFQSLTKEALEEAVAGKREELDAYFVEAQQVLKTITSREFNSKLSHLPYEVREDLKALRTRVLGMDPSQQLDGVSAFIAEAAVVSQQIRQQMNALEDSDFIIYMELNLLAQEFYPLVNTLFEGLDSGFLYDTLRDIRDNISRSRSIYLEQATKYGLDSLMIRLSPTIKNIDQTYKAEKERITALKNNSPSKFADSFDKKLKELDDKYAIEKIDTEKLNNIILGKEKDISRLVNMVRATHAIPDIIIGTVVGKIKESFNKVNRNFLTRRNQAGEVYDVYAKSKGLNAIADIQSDGERLTEIVTEYRVKDGEIEAVNTVALLSNYSSDYTSTMSLIRAARASQKTWEELLEYPPIKEKAGDATSLRNWQTTFERQNSELPYTDYFYETDALLDQEFNIGTVEDPIIKSLRDMRNESYEALNNLQREIKMNGYQVSEDQVSEFRRLEKERKNYFRPEGKPAVWEDINEAMMAYSERRRQFSSYSVTDRTREAFERARAYQEKLSQEANDPDAYSRWLSINAETTPRPSFLQKLADLRRELNDLQQKLELLTGFELGSKDWNELLDIVGPFYVDGQKVASDMDPPLLKKANAIYRRAMETGMSNPAFIHLSPELRAQYRALQLDYRTARKDQFREAEAKMSLADFEAVHARTVSKEEAQTYARMLAIYNEFAKLQTTHATDDYYQEYDKQLSLFLEEKGLSSVPPSSFTGYIYTFKFDGTTFTREDVAETVAIDQSQFEQAWKNTFVSRFQQSDWYIDNHTTNIKFDKKTKTYFEEVSPSYPWIKKVPTDKDEILENEPAGPWKELTIRDIPATATTPAIKIIREDYSLDIQNSAKPSAAYIANNPSSKKLNPAEQKYLEYLTLNYFKDQEKYPTGQRMGLRLPAIERDLSFVDTFFSSKEKGIADTMTRVGQQMGRQIVTDAQDFDESYGNVNREYLPVYFSQSIPINLQDFNLHKIFLKYGHASMQFEELQENTVPLIRSIEDSMDAAGGAHRTLKDKNGLSTGGSENVRLSMLRDTNDMLLYGQSERKTAGFDITENTLVLGKVKALQGKNIRWEKAFGSLIGVRAFGLMFGSLLPQIPNYLNIVYNSIIETAGHKGLINFSLRAWWQAYKEVHVTHASEYMLDMQKTNNKSKFTQMLEYFDAIPGELYDNAGYELENNLGRNLISTDIGFFLKNAVEWSGGATVFKAMANAYLVNGVPIYEAFEIVRGQLVVKEGFDITQEIKEDFTKKVRAAIWDINGNYAKQDKTLLSREWYGRAMEFMKKFMVPFFERRYSKKRFSESHGRYIEGFHRTGYKALGSMLRDLVSNFDLLRDPRILSTHYNKLTIHEQDGLRKFGAEMAMFVMMWVLTSLVWDDDDEDRFKDLKKMNYAHQAAIYGILKTTKEVETFILPFSITENINMGQRSLQEILPVITQVAEMAKHIDADSPWFLETYKRDEGIHDKGDIKLWADITKLMGHMPTKYTPEAGIKAVEFASR
jgi:hypothetical protein